MKRPYPLTQASNFFMIVSKVYLLLAPVLLQFLLLSQVGRIRQSLVFEANGLDLFVSGDQLLRGAALNAVIIAEKIVERRSDPIVSGVEA